MEGQQLLVSKDNHRSKIIRKLIDIRKLFSIINQLIENFEISINGHALIPIHPVEV